MTSILNKNYEYDTDGNDAESNSKNNHHRKSNHNKNHQQKLEITTDSYDNAKETVYITKFFSSLFISLISFQLKKKINNR